MPVPKFFVYPVILVGFFFVQQALGHNGQPSNKEQLKIKATTDRQYASIINAEANRRLGVKTIKSVVDEE